MRLMHVHGASLFFFFTYVHIARGLFLDHICIQNIYVNIRGYNVIVNVITALLAIYYLETYELLSCKNYVKLFRRVPT